MKLLAPSVDEDEATAAWGITVMQPPVKILCQTWSSTCAHPPEEAGLNNRARKASWMDAKTVPEKPFGLGD